MRIAFPMPLMMLAALLIAGTVSGQERPPAVQPQSKEGQSAVESSAATKEDPAVEPSADDTAIRANVAKYVESYNRRDWKTMASMWSPDAVYTNSLTGDGIVGQEAIAKQLEYEFAGAEDAQLAVVVDSIEFFSPNVAIEKGSATVSYSEHPPEETTYTVVHVKRDGKWLIDRVSEAPAPPAPHSNYEQLKDLEWMIGSWIDQDESATIQTDCEWTKNRNFITRAFAATVGDQIDMSGMQVVGWDPAAKQIRSWVFDSEGGFGESTWAKKDEQWFITTKGTLPDGRQYSAVQIITPVDENSFTWQSTDRQAGGEILPNVEEVMIVRAPEESAE